MPIPSPEKYEIEGEEILKKESKRLRTVAHTFTPCVGRSHCQTRACLGTKPRRLRLMQLTEQFHIPDEYHKSCDRLTQLVQKHTRRLRADKYWTGTHLNALTLGTGLHVHPGQRRVRVSSVQTSCGITTSMR